MAAGRPYREIADWLTGEHDISDWWAQKHIVEYEQVRGLRAPGVRPGGTFTVTASKTVAVPVEDLFDAFVDADVRDRWLPGVVLHERTSRPGRSARFDWEDGATRVNVGFAANGEAASQAAVEHERSPQGLTSTVRSDRRSQSASSCAGPEPHRVGAERHRCLRRRALHRHLGRARVVLGVVRPGPLDIIGRDNPFELGPPQLRAVFEFGIIGIAVAAVLGVGALATRHRSADAVERAQLKPRL